MAESTVHGWPGEQLPAGNYPPAQFSGPGGPGGYAPERPARPANPAQGAAPPQRAVKSRLDDWMEVEFKFGGSRIKRRVVALVLLGLPALVPLFFMVPSVFTVNDVTIGGSVDDTLGTGAEVCLFLCLLVSPLALITGQRWFVPLRRWYGIMMAVSAIGDATAAGITDDFAGGVFGRLAGHVFELMGLFMVMLVVPVLVTSSAWAQRRLGKYWKRLQRLTYVIWGLLFLHLSLLEGLGVQSGINGSGFAGDGDPVFHQRFYQYSACSLFLLVLRLPPVKRWVVARQKEGRGWLVYLAAAPMVALFIFGFAFIINEQVFKGTGSFTEQPSAE